MVDKSVASNLNETSHFVTFNHITQILSVTSQGSIQGRTDFKISVMT